MAAPFMQIEVDLSETEPERPGFGCRWIGMGTPFISDTESPDLQTNKDEV